VIGEQNPIKRSFLADSGQKGGNRRFMPLAYPRTHQRKQTQCSPKCTLDWNLARKRGYLINSDTSISTAVANFLSMLIRGSLLLRN